jgi:hypothetical protein
LFEYPRRKNISTRVVREYDDKSFFEILWLQNIKSQDTKKMKLIEKLKEKIGRKPTKIKIDEYALKIGEARARVC